MKEIQILPLREELKVMSNNLFNVIRISDYRPCFIAMLKYQPAPAVEAKMKTAEGRSRWSCVFE